MYGRARFGPPSRHYITIHITKWNAGHFTSHHITPCSGVMGDHRLLAIIIDAYWIIKSSSAIHENAMPLHCTSSHVRRAIVIIHFDSGQTIKLYKYKQTLLWAAAAALVLPKLCRFDLNKMWEFCRWLNVMTTMCQGNSNRVRNFEAEQRCV